MINKLLIYLFCLFTPLTLVGQFVCPPCAADCDTLTFTAAGDCPHCGMTLIDAPPEISTSDTALARLQVVQRTPGALLETVSWLSDVHGPRLLGTQNYWQALQWTAAQLRAWEIDEISYHSFDRNHRGWELRGFAAELVAPAYAPLLVYPAAYTRATAGPVEGEVVYLDHWQDLYTYEGDLTGKILLLGDTYRSVGNDFSPTSRRYTEEELATAAANPDPNHRVLGYLSRRSINRALREREDRRTLFAEFFRQADALGVVAIIEASDFPYGLLHADGNNHFPSYPYVDDIQPTPGFVMANEHFGRLRRLLDKGLTPRLRLRLDAEYTVVPEYQQNLLATLPGSASSTTEETVIIGGHFDSWHAGTGAVDNASGVAVMMEALRLLKASGLPLRRSVQLALWGGEEQYYAGSFAYVQEFVGDLENGELQAAAERISAYFNLDNGAGKIRGLYTQGNRAVLPFFTEWLAPFPTANTLTVQYANQTDHELFDRLNVPAFQFIQDPLNYLSIVHHTNLDVLEYVEEADLQANALIVAYLVYRAANAPIQLPRKAHNSPSPSRTGNVLFELAGFEQAEEVQLIGDFNNWNLFGTPLYRTDEGWACRLDLPPGEYLYKFYVDGRFLADPQTPTDELVEDGKGHGGLTKLIVR